MSVLTDTFELANGVKIPKVGFGTWQTPAGDVAYQAVRNALKVGYRHIDTAKAYGNEEDVGRAVRDSGIARDQIFVTSKLPAHSKTYDEAMADFESTFKKLNIDYVDLYLVHAPWPWDEIGKDCDKGNVEVWRAMQDIYASGRVKAIGVSNFNVHDLKNVLADAKVKPMVNQIQYYVGYTEPKITSFAKQNGILVEAYSPLATGGLLKNDQMLALAKENKVSVAQLALRFCLQNNILPLPKAVGQSHIEDNAKLDFEISDEDMEKLNGMPDTAPEHSHNKTQG
ncbi:oxidoreductase of aldo/keto reductase family, subgroup 1 [Pediococcus damnosus]|uniref:Oxidoreductase of aldo/keto reductase family, subgroup 1 n=1 Tax=Pediococcus damnosus TaxID=51663 RepID=A0A0R2HHI0_9LACO|nr:aldo/keto reductase [Pediococcus damnosus]AMV60348.1 oxidoreductase of aldo/keto reductase family, subgroup 1 [Pediococcus damnosus]AMV62882.1 oxidoreductase of aldo/keto reductase family, subgroup 1 [Pediococcus damnosus]AMV64598.1 oxidoreductase of aldo/keto reductase family, subgroup 1 [Pediococcus damnosus]AMV67234.1 oxidoreductase of aldo/keto reductase family, subgroup 1 [Pediococcus damnosus]AMV69538.1 oxidoreductase of aldo/keto reductase family, subgroup 1 [Pediococcus damnosus]